MSKFGILFLRAAILSAATLIFSGCMADIARITGSAEREERDRFTGKHIDEVIKEYGYSYNTLSYEGDDKQDGDILYVWDFLLSNYAYRVDSGTKIEWCGNQRCVVRTSKNVHKMHGYYSYFVVNKKGIIVRTGREHYGNNWLFQLRFGG